MRGGQLIERFANFFSQHMTTCPLLINFWDFLRKVNELTSSYQQHHQCPLAVADLDDLLTHPGIGFFNGRPCGLQFFKVSQVYLFAFCQYV